jgi:hypothetical protein
MSRTRNHAQGAVPACKNHPGVPALSGQDVCKSCAHYAQFAKDQAAAGKAPPSPLKSLKPR